MAEPDHRARAIPKRALDAARDQASERLGSPLAHEQERALHTLTGPERIAALEGQAGTGKGVVIEAVARAERISGRTVIGVALAGATAQRLGEDSPALHGRTTTIASLLARHNQTGQDLDRHTTLILDEAGMVDTPTLAQLVQVSHDTGAKLIAVGDGKQLPAIGPGGMFDQFTHNAPKAMLTTVRRTQDRDEQRAWRALRNGKPETAMAHYLARGQLHLHEDRDQALNAAANRYDTLTKQHGIGHVALITDGPTSEVDRLNARVQHLRDQRGELGHETVDLTGDDGPHYGLKTGDLIAWRQIQTVPGDARIENGTRGIITNTDPRKHQVDVKLTGSGRHVTVTGPEQLDRVRLAYAQHVVRQQGATVDHAVAITGGWQTSRESAYVQASRARHGIDWHIAKTDLGASGTDPDRLTRLAKRMATSRAKTPSLDHKERATLPISLGETGIDLTRPVDVLEPAPLAPTPVPDPAIDI